MENAIGFVFLIVFFIFYSIKSFPLPRFIVGKMYENERESLDKFIRGIGMFIGIFGMNKLFFNYLEGVMGENFIMAFIFYIGLFFLLKIAVDMVVWKIGSLWINHLLVYLSWAAVFVLMIYILGILGIDPESTFGLILSSVLIIFLVWWLYAKYFHTPWKFTRRTQISD